MFDRNRNPDRYEAPRPVGPQNQYQWSGVAGYGQAAGTRVVPQQGVLTMSFLWMFVALLASAGAALFVVSNAGALQFVIRNFFILIIAEFAFVMAISFGINRLGALPGLALLFAYAVLNGATIAVIVLAQRQLSGSYNGVITAFLGAASVFGGAALYGVVTRRDLTKLGGILFMGLIGIIVVSLLNAFLIHGTTLSLVISVVGVVIFTGLTAFHVQAIQNGRLAARDRESASVIGALLLYLDFVNLFLMMLRLFGGNRN